MFRAQKDSLSSEADLTIVHLTDLHLASHGTVTNTPWTHKISIGGYRLHRPCTATGFAHLEQAIKLIGAELKPDVVVITGDIVDRGDDREALVKGAEIIRRLTCPVVVAKGDHDIAQKNVNFRCWEEAFGAVDGQTDVRGFPFFFLPFETTDEAVTRFESALRRDPGSGSIRFLCLHRMLQAPRLMDRLAKWFHGCSVLDPRREMLRKVLVEAGGPWVVLCGHSHTQRRDTWGSVTQFCTGSLAEYPHSFRVIKVRDGRVWTSIVRLNWNMSE